MSMYFSKTAAGLKLTLDQWSSDAAEPFRALLHASGVSFIEGQKQLPNNASETYFKVEPKDTERVQRMISLWATTFDDLNCRQPSI